MYTQHLWHLNHVPMQEKQTGSLGITDQRMNSNRSIESFITVSPPIISLSISLARTAETFHLQCRYTEARSLSTDDEKQKIVMVTEHFKSIIIIIIIIHSFISCKVEPQSVLENNQRASFKRLFKSVKIIF